MKNKKIALIAASAVVIAVVLGVAVGLFFGHNKELQQTTITPISKENFEDPAAWGKNFPAQYESYLENEKITDNPSHFDSRPYMQLMYSGIGYSAEFNEPRGHLYMLEDIRAVDPVRWEAHGAACNTCKSTQIPGLIEKYGDEYYKMDFHDINDQLKHPVGCANCHDPQTNELIITQPPLIEAMEARGVDLSKVSRQEMRTLVCAQCHVTYYFPEDTNKVTFPWGEGLTADDQIKYYDKIDFTEWTHGETGAPMIKPRHEEYEYFKGSTHETAGVACADCHMPYMKKGNQKISSHVWQSPLNNIEQSCMTCHRENEEWLRDRVANIQNQTKEMEDRGGAVVTETIEVLAAAKDTPGIDKDMLKEAQQKHRYGQYYLDTVMVTNGYGFHNPQRTLSDLAKGIDNCQQATRIASEAIIKAGGTVPTVESN